MREKLFNNISYLSNYRVFCFSDIEIPKHSIKTNQIHYEIGDFVPTSGYNYIYNPNLLIVDYFNKVVHVIAKYKYCEIFYLNQDILKISTDSILYKMMNGRFNYKVIDVYGNFLNVRTIDDLIVAICTYPQIELSLVNNKFLMDLESNGNISDIALESINYTNSESIVFMHGNYKTTESNVSDMCKVVHNVKSSLLDKPLQIYKDTWFNRDSLICLANEFLVNIRLLYILTKNNIGMPCVYYDKDLKKITHVGKVKKWINEFIQENECGVLESIFEIIFSYAEFDDEYDDFIISTISEYAMLKIIEN